MLKPDIKFDNDDFRRSLKIMKEFLADQNITTNDFKKQNICQMLKMINRTGTLSFRIPCTEIDENIQLQMAIMERFDEIQRESLSITNDTLLQKYNAQVEQVNENYEKFTIASNIFDDKVGLNSLFIICNNIKEAQMLAKMNILMMKNDLLQHILNQYLDIKTNVTLDEFKFVMADILKVAQMSIYCRALTDGQNLQQTSILSKSLLNIPPGDKFYC